MSFRLASAGAPPRSGDAGGATSDRELDREIENPMHLAVI